MIQGQIVWFEIPVKDLDRSMFFYSEVLAIKIQKVKFLEQEYGILNKDKDTIKGVLIERKDHNPKTEIILFFYVVDILESLREVVRLGGQIVIGKTMLKQKTKDGQILITSNLIDGELGYYAEFIDCEGNRICLYSNS